MQRRLAISIKQPFAEQIMRGTKKFEYRSCPTAVRGRVYVYASLTPRPRGDWKGLRFVLEDVPVGLVVGSVEVVGCRRIRSGKYAWVLKSPRPLSTPIRPRAHPQPVWFYPFGRKAPG